MMSVISRNIVLTETNTSVENDYEQTEQEFTVRISQLQIKTDKPLLF